VFTCEQSMDVVVIGRQRLSRYNSQSTLASHRRLHSTTQSPYIITIGADSMTAMGAIAPTAKKVVGAMPPSRPNGNFVMSPLYTAKRYSTNYEIVEKGALISARNASKAFGSRAPPGEAPCLDERNRGTDKGRRRERDGRGDERGGRSDKGRTGRTGGEKRKARGKRA